MKFPAAGVPVRGPGSRGVFCPCRTNTPVITKMIRDKLRSTKVRFGCCGLLAAWWASQRVEILNFCFMEFSLCFCELGNCGRSLRPRWVKTLFCPPPKNGYPWSGFAVHRLHGFTFRLPAENSGKAKTVCLQ